MKKTFSINVGGFPFTIDDDAYSLLSDYLNTIAHAFSRLDDGVEIVSDIESRVAELLLECTASGSPIITAGDVEQVISRVGKPEEMIDGNEDIVIDGSDGDTHGQESFSTTPPPFHPPLPPVKRKLFRDPQNAMLGGVCSGLAWYLKIDTTAVRLITILLTVLSVSTCGLAYIILWIVVPEADNPLQRMQMMGEEPTVENIGKTVTDSFKEDNSYGRNVNSSTPSGIGSAITNIVSILAKVMIVIGMIFALIILVAMAIGLFGCLFALITFGTSWSGTIFGEVSPIWYNAGNIPLYGVVCGIGSILTLGIPLFLLVRKGFKMRSPLSHSIKILLTLLWIIGFITAAASTGRIVNLVYEQECQEQKERNERKARELSWEEASGEQIDSEAAASLAADSIGHSLYDSIAEVSADPAGLPGGNIN